MYGLDISIVDIGSIKGISNCIVNFDYGNFESCQFNAKNSLTGGVFSVIDTGHETINLDEFLRGNLEVTVVSVKRGFEVLCDGKCSVDMTTSQLVDKSDRVLPHLFRLKGCCRVSLDLLYRNKGPTRIKAGSISIEVRVYELNCTAPSASPTTDLENSKVEEEEPEQQSGPLTEIYIAPDSDSSDAGEQSDGSIDRFMAQFRPINKAVLTDGKKGGISAVRKSGDSLQYQSRPKTSGGLHGSTNSLRSSGGSSAVLKRRPTTATVNGSRSSSSGRPPWNDNVLFVPAPTDMARIRSYEKHHTSSTNSGSRLRDSQGSGSTAATSTVAATRRQQSSGSRNRLTNSSSAGVNRKSKFSPFGGML